MSQSYDYALTGNCTSAALISSDCSIDWLCLPFFDSESLFCRILDKEKGGFFKISAVDTIRVFQKYVPNTPIVKTTFETKHGDFEVRDYMPRYKTYQDEYICPSEIHRDIFVIRGVPRIIFELDAMPNYALGKAQYRFFDNYIKITSTAGRYNSFYLYSNLDHKKIVEGTPIELKEPTSFCLLSYHEKIEKVTPYKIYLDYEKTKSYWLDWVYRTKIPQNYQDIVIRSIITLKLLMYQRTGAVIAAPTASLPEIIGKNRNWDYRYCWVRDASMIIDLYVRLGHARSSTRYINFILNRMLLKHEDIAVMYGINGERQLTEQTLDHLSGYENSKPVRIGNNAYLQDQNDVHGELIETIYTYYLLNKHTEMKLTEEIWTVVRSLVNNVMATWKNPDAGIWERRDVKEHYVHSKLMSWVAMDRATKIALAVGNQKYADKCLTIAKEIKEDILAKGWNEKVKAFTMAYGSESMDASILLMLHYGFLSAQDPRMVSTVEQMYKRLVKDDFVFRYDGRDDFGVPENAFIVCVFWMINALYLIGEKQKAQKMLENIMSCANRHGLFAEDIEITTKRQTGNFPQGYSHLALIQTILVFETNYNWSDAYRF